MPRAAFSCLVVAAGCLLLPAGHGRGQDFRETPDFQACKAGNSAPDIAACSRLLETETEASRRRLALLFGLRGEAWKKQGDLDRALADFSEAIKFDPGMTAALLERAEIHRQNNNCDSAIADYSTVISLQPKQTQPHIGRALCLAAKEELERAVDDLNQAIKLESASPTRRTLLAWHLKAQIDAGKGALDDALADYDAALRLVPKRSALYVERGTIWSRKGEVEKALRDYDQAIRLDEDNTDGSAVTAWALKARTYSSRSEVDHALAAIDEAIRLNPQVASLYLLRGDLWNRRGDAARALADYNHAVQVDPENIVAHNIRGDFLRNSGEYGRAIASYDAAIKKRPADLAAYGSRGLVRFYLADFATAVDEFKRVVDEQANAYSMLLLYVSRSRIGKAQDAKAELARNAVKLDARAWPFPLVELYLGRISPSAAEVAASSRDEKCEAQFYIGEWNLIRNASEAARKALAAARDTCPKAFVEYRGALEELKRMQ